VIEVYHFLLDHRVGGPQVYVDSIRRTLAKDTSCTVVTTGRGPMTDVALFNLRHFWNPLYLLEVPLNVLRIFYLAAVGRIRTKNAIFDIHGGANVAPIAAARLLGVPVAWHFHETLAKLRLFVTLGRWLLKGHPHGIVVVADEVKATFKLEHDVVIPAPADTDYWSRGQTPEDASTDRGWAPIDTRAQPFRILAVGNLNPLKGPDVLLEAVSKLGGPWHAIIAGAELDTHRKYAADLRHRAAELQASGKDRKITFLGWCVPSKVRSLMATCDVFVLPSRSEACPIALLEAMAMGCVCVAADVGGVRAMLPAHLHDLVFKAGDASELARRLSEARKLSLSERRERGRISRQQTVESFSIGRVSELTMKYYRSLLAAHAQ
jgi:glycosyltransferase involved in cell wall biosynthesis